MQNDRTRYVDVAKLINRTALAHFPATVGLYSNTNYFAFFTDHYA